MKWFFTLIMNSDRFCLNCGCSSFVSDRSLGGKMVCIQCGSSLVNDSLEISALKSKRLSAGLCGILLGGFGVHKFILGYNQQGYIYLGAFIGTFCFGGFLLVSILALVEGIIYLSMPIEQFKKTYIENKKEWF